MNVMQQAAWDKLIGMQIFLAAALILVVAILLVELRQVLRRNPRVGAIAGYIVLVTAFALYKASPFNKDAQLLFSAGLLGLAVSLIASIILSDPPEAPQHGLRAGVALGFDSQLEKFKRRVGDIQSAKISDRHKKLKIEEISNELAEFLDRVDRISAQDQSAPET